MDRAQKFVEVDLLKERFQSSELVVVTHYSGLTVKQMSDLRNRLRAAGGSYKVSKNTLFKRAANDTPFSVINHLFAGTVGIASSADPVVAAKIVNEFSKENEKLVILGGCLNGQALDVSGVKQLADLPSLDELRAKLAGLLVAPHGKLARILQTPAQLLVGVTKAYGEKA